MIFIAKDRPSGSAHWQLVQDRCAQVFEEAGLAVTRQAYGTGVNVIGELKGSNLPNEVVMLSAHYDSVPNCAGADDNASGVAGLWRAARSMVGQRPERSVVLACWDEEELGLVGSRAFVSSLTGRKIVAHLVFEMIGFVNAAEESQTLPPRFGQLFPDAFRTVRSRESRGDFIALVADKASRSVADSYERHSDRLQLPVVRVEVPEELKNSDALNQLRRSDHASFWMKEWPSLMLTDTAGFRNPNYHCAKGSDAPATLNYEFAVKTVDAAVATIQDASGKAEAPRQAKAL